MWKKYDLEKTSLVGVLCSSHTHATFSFFGHPNKSNDFCWIRNMCEAECACVSQSAFLKYTGTLGKMALVVPPSWKARFLLMHSTFILFPHFFLIACSVVIVFWNCNFSKPFLAVAQFLSLLPSSGNLPQFFFCYYACHNCIVYGTSFACLDLC